MIDNHDAATTPAISVEEQAQVTGESVPTIQTMTQESTVSVARPVVGRGVQGPEKPAARVKPSKADGQKALRPVGEAPKAQPPAPAAKLPTSKIIRPIARGQAISPDAVMTITIDHTPCKDPNGKNYPRYVAAGFKPGGKETTITVKEAVAKGFTIADCRWAYERGWCDLSPDLKTAR
jgi:hypothetical protein